MGGKGLSERVVQIGGTTRTAYLDESKVTGLVWFMVYGQSIQIGFLVATSVKN